MLKKKSMSKPNEAVEKVSISMHKRAQTLKEQHKTWKKRKLLLRKLQSPLLTVAKKATRSIEKELVQKPSASSSV